MNIQLDQVTKAYEGVKVLEDITKEFSHHHIHGLLGVNGAGKSTLFKIIAGLESPDSGHIYFDGNEVEPNSHQCTYIGQDPFLFQGTVLRNVMYPSLFKGKSKKQARSEAGKWLGRFGIEYLANHDVASLSGGEKKKVAFARSLVLQPEVLLLDEPTAHLDMESARQVMNVMKHYYNKKKVTILIITHYRHIAREYCHHLYTLNRGSLEAINDEDKSIPTYVH